MSMLFKRIKDWAATITAFRTGDVIPVDGPSGTAKMLATDLLKETAENALDSIHLLSDTATDADLVAGNYFAIDGDETKRLPANIIAKSSDLSEEVESVYKKDSVDITSLFTFAENAQICGDVNSPFFGNATSSTNFVCSDYVDVSKYYELEITCLVRKWTASALSGLCFYDGNKSPVNGQFLTYKTIASDGGFTKVLSVSVPSSAKYIRTTMYSQDSLIGTNTVAFSCIGYKYSMESIIDKVVDGFELNINQDFVFNKYGQIIAEASNANFGNLVSSSNFWSSDFVDVSKFSEVRVSCVVRKYTATAFTGLVLYDKNKSPLIGYYYTDNGIVEGEGYLSIKSIKIPVNAVYVRTTIFSIESAAGYNDDQFQFVGKLKNIKYLYESEETSSFAKNFSCDFSVIPCSFYPQHDATYCKTTDKIYAFNKYGDQWYGELKVYDRNFSAVSIGNRINLVEVWKDATTNPLQFKSVDCNKVNDVLLVGNGQSTYSPDDSYVYLFYEWLSWASAGDNTITFANCGDYVKLDFTELGVKCYAWWWGENPTNDRIIVNTNFFNDFYIVRLGKGTNELSKGTYTAVSNDKYNGTWEVIKHFSQKVPSTGTYAQHGGQVYDGSLYLVNNDSAKNEIYKIILDDVDGVHIDVISAETNDPTTGNIIYRFIDGMFCLDGYMYGAPLYINDVFMDNDHATDKVVLKMKIPR